MRAIIDMTGRVIGKLTVIRQSERPPNSTRETYWLCRCECGNEIVATGWRLRKNTRACRCAVTKHGHASNGRPSREYSSWHAMIHRCENPNATGYPYYGGRGIAVCERWRKSFQSFLDDMGPRPEKHSLEREDTGGNYDPENCIWADMRTQLLNRRNTVIVNFRGEDMPLSRVIDISGTPFSYFKVHYRLTRSNFTLDQALFEHRSRNGRPLKVIDHA